MKAAILKMAASALSRLPRGIFLDAQNFQVWERRGIHVTPAHFYFPVPILSELDEKVWNEPSEMVGVDMRLDAQIALARHFSETYFGAYAAAPDGDTPIARAYAKSTTYGGTDGAMLYSMIRERKPKRIIEIGSGGSTILSALAAEHNEKEGAPRCQITAIEPYPSDFLTASVGDRVEIREERVETVPLDLFASLEKNDILFIDSSHTVKVGGDVVFEINEVLPRLAPGVVIHIHDIAFPFNYPKKSVVGMRQFWAEQYLLQAFLAFNPEFRVLWCFSYVQAKAPETFQRYFPFYSPGGDTMGALWMERVAGPDQNP